MEVSLVASFPPPSAFADLCLDSNGTERTTRTESSSLRSLGIRRSPSQRPGTKGRPSSFVSSLTFLVPAHLVQDADLRYV